MHVWDTALPGRPPRVSIMCGWDGRCFGGHGRLLVHQTTARRIYDECGGDATWTTDELLSVVSHALIHATDTTITTPTSGLAVAA